MWSRLCLVHMSMPEVLLSIRQNRHTRCTLVLGGLGGVSPACIGSAGREGGQAERRTPALSVLCCPNSETTPKTLIPSNKFDDGMWIGLGKRRTNSEKDGMNSEKDGIHGTPKTPESLYPCGFAGCPRVRARKNKKKQEKNGGEKPRLVGKSQGTSTHRPPPCGWGKGGYAAEQPYMPKLGPLSLSRLLLRWASLACSCCHSATLGEAMTAFTVRAT